MTDPGEIVRAGVTAAKLSAAAGASIPFTALARRMLGPAADEVAEMMRDSIRLYRYNRQLKLLHKAEAMASKAGFTPEVVSLKILFPLLEGASLEEDEDIHTMWAALLANASHPDASDLVLPSFAEVLKILTPNEAKFLDAAYKYAVSKLEPVDLTPASELGIMYENRDVGVVLEPGHREMREKISRTERMKSLTQVDLGTYNDLLYLFEHVVFGRAARVITSDSSRDSTVQDLEARYQFAVAFEETQRLQMWSFAQRSSGEHFYLSSFGSQFMTVCNEPASEKPE